MTEEAVLGNQETGLVAEATTEAETPTEAGGSFIEQLAEEYRGDPSLQSFKSVDDLAKSYIHAQKTIGKKFENLSPEEIRAHYNGLSAPESLDDYKFELGDEVDGNAVEWFKSVAKENGLSADAAKTIAEGYYNMQREQLEQHYALQEQQRQEHIESVKKMFGKEFESKVHSANQALTELGGNEAIEAIKQAGLDSHPAVVRLLANAGELLAEGNLANATSKVQRAMTPERAAEKIQELLSDRDFQSRRMNSMARGHEEAVSQLEQLYRIKNGIA